MPTRWGNIFAQWNDWRWTAGPDVIVTVRPNNRDITAASSIATYGTSRNDHWGEAGVWQVVAGGNLEEFNDRFLPTIHRNNVTEIRFRMRVTDCTIFARHKIDYWN